MYGFQRIYHLLFEILHYFIEDTYMLVIVFRLQESVRGMFNKSEISISCILRSMGKSFREANRATKVVSPCINGGETWSCTHTNNLFHK